MRTAQEARGGTSAAAPMRQRLVHLVIGLPCALGADSTSAGAYHQQLELGDRTDAGIPRQIGQQPAQAVADMRRIAGLTYEEVATLCAVTRRTIHHWVSGRPIDAANEKRLLEVLEALRAIDRGAADATRDALFRRIAGQEAPFGLLAKGHMVEGVRAAGCGRVASRQSSSPATAEIQEARRPLPVEALLDARHEPIHRDPGPGRVIRLRRKKR